MPAASTALKSQGVEDPSPHSEAELVAEVRSIQPGRPFTVAVRLTLEPGWHSYWRNPGDAGRATVVSWALPAGFRAGEIQWPYPRRIEVASIVSYGLEGEVLLLAEIAPPRYLTPGYPVRFAADVDWLVCHEICLPAEARVELVLPIRDETPAPDARWSAALEAARENLPVVAEGWAMAAWRSPTGFVLEVTPRLGPVPSLQGMHFFAGERGVVEHGAPQEYSAEGGAFRLSLRRLAHAAGVVERLRGVLVLPEGVQASAAGGRALAVDVEVADAAPGATAPGAGRLASGRP